jgi:Cellulase (glycosyl hydrolase family 5)
VRRIVRIVLAMFVLSALAAPTAYAAERMWVGFHDDPSFRWADNRATRIESTATNGSTIIRLLIAWNEVAKQRPDVATDPFDTAYNFGDIDEAVRTAQEHDLEVMLTISGTPAWANGGKRHNVMPTRVSDFQAFAQAIASRYSGRNANIPFVRFFSIWNEPNLNLFLTPQFNSKGKSIAPRNYAKLAAAGFAGIKAGNSLAKVAIGETSARGRDKRVKGLSDTHSPGKFAELVAKANPRLRFDAWAHHPYPFHPNSAPSQVVKWPNVSLGSLPRFNKSLKRWFRGKAFSIWITEYGHQTRPQDRLGVPYSTQATYIKRSLTLARNYPFVGMFIWFVYQDDPGQPWESGLYTSSGAAKNPSPSRFSSSARPLDARNAVHSVRRGTQPLVNVAARKFCSKNASGAMVDVSYRVLRGSSQVATASQQVALRPDCTLSLRLSFTAARGQRYTATITLSDGNGVNATRTLSIRGT